MLYFRHMRGVDNFALRSWMPDELRKPKVINGFLVIPSGDNFGDLPIDDKQNVICDHDFCHDSVKCACGCLN